MVGMDKTKKMQEEFELENDTIAFKEYSYITSFIAVTYSLIADELSKLGDFNQGQAVDLGCGLGDLVIEIAKRYPELKIIGIDISKEAIIEASSKIKEHNLINVNFKIEDIHRLSFEDNSIDLVLSHGVIHHLRNAFEALAEIFRIMKPGALAYLTDLRRDAPNEIIKEVKRNLPANQAKGFINSIHASYTPDEIEEMLEDLGIKNFSITDQRFSRQTIMKNIDMLRKSPLRNSNFSKLSQVIILRK
jgi:ubiquinone/menaquinone biosynthesis C-methylase UbiE